MDRLTSRADEVMDAYSNLSSSEKREFDKRYKDLQRFVKFTKAAMVEIGRKRDSGQKGGSK